MKQQLTKTLIGGVAIMDPPPTNTAKSVAEVVGNGFCIGCGLCQTLSNDRIKMTMTDYGSLRPNSVRDFTSAEEQQILSVCPGAVAEARIEDGLQTDAVWGAFYAMSYAWAGNPEVRFRAATGGTLTALALTLLKTGQVHFILHVGADPQQPMRSRWFMSTTSEEVISRAGSRYGPVAPLSGLGVALAQNKPFAIIAKPCDLGAVHRFAAIDSRIERLCVARLAMVCGGQSRLKKSTDILDEHGIKEQEVTLFRYRGYGNPGRARIETSDGCAIEKTYNELWASEAGWELETRCKLCPDALGEAADVASADVWPGGAPLGEDAGFNGIIVRSKNGAALVAEAVANRDLIVGKAITPRQFDDFQPHQVRKKEALSSRYAALAETGKSVINTINLRIEELGQRLPARLREQQKEATIKRVKSGRFAEPV